MFPKRHHSSNTLGSAALMISGFEPKPASNAAGLNHCSSRSCLLRE
jgi:hypothetical protein